MTAPYDVYRNPDARKLMLEYVMRTFVVSASEAVTRLRSIETIQGLSAVYWDAVASVTRPRVDYDPLAIGRI